MATIKGDQNGKTENEKQDVRHEKFCQWTYQRLDTTEKRISKFKDMSLEIIQTEIKGQ